MISDETQRETAPDFDTYLAGGGKLTAPVNATARYRAELLRLMAVFVDSEMAGASGFADCINFAPGLPERIAATRIVLEKFEHAEAMLSLMASFGADTRRYANHHPWARRVDRESDLGTTRVDGDMRLNVFHYPIADWTDAVVMNALMGAATVIQLTDWLDSSYQPFADTVAAILPAETRHANHGKSGLEQLSERDGAAVQRSIDYWSGRVAASFGRTDSPRIELYRRFRLRTRSNEQLLEDWQVSIAGLLRDCQLRLPGAGTSKR